MPFHHITKYAFKQTGGVQSNSFALLFAVSLLFLIIKVFLVYWSYNEIIPSLSNGNLRPITFLEALILVILFQSLFS